MISESWRPDTVCRCQNRGRVYTKDSAEEPRALTPPVDCPLIPTAYPVRLSRSKHKDGPNSTRSRHSSARMATAHFIVKDRSLRANHSVSCAVGCQRTVAATDVAPSSRGSSPQSINNILLTCFLSVQAAIFFSGRQLLQRRRRPVRPGL